MRIAYLAESAIPSREANSVQVMKMCQAFAKLGHEVTLYSRVGPEPAEDLHAYYGVEPVFDIVRRRRPRIGRLGRAVFGWTISRELRTRPLPAFLYGRDLYGLSASADLKIPFMLEAHGFAQGLAQRMLQRWLLRRPNCRGLVVISQALADDYREKFSWWPSERTLVAHDAAEIHEVASSAEVGAWVGRTGHLQVGYLGHLYRGKGMEIIHPLAQRMPDVDFHVLGGTEADLATWQMRIDGLSNLRLHGYVIPQRTESFRQAMDVLLVPTQKEVARAGGGPAQARWISPLKLFESMASRKAIVASDLPVLREVLTDRVNALLVEPDRVEAWQEAIHALNSDSQLRQRLSEQAYLDVTTRFTWGQRAQEVLGRVDR